MHGSEGNCMKDLGDAVSEGGNKKTRGIYMGEEEMQERRGNSGNHEREGGG